MFLPWSPPERITVFVSAWLGSKEITRQPLRVRNPPLRDQVSVRETKRGCVRRRPHPTLVVHQVAPVRGTPLSSRASITEHIDGCLNGRELAGNDFWKPTAGCARCGMNLRMSPVHATFA